MPVEQGRKIFVKVDLNGVGGVGANWQKVAQQIEGEHGRTSDTIDATNKDDFGWASAVVSQNNWTISCGGAMKVGDSVLAFVRTSWRNQVKIWVQIDRSQIGDLKEEGLAIITDFSESFPDKELVKYKLDLKGDGAIVTSP